MCFLQVNIGAKTQCLSMEIGVGVVIPCWWRSQLYYPCSENKGTDQLCGAVTAKLICVFVFAYADCWFFHATAQISWLHGLPIHVIHVANLAFWFSHDLAHLF